VVAGGDAEGSFGHSLLGADASAPSLLGVRPRPAASAAKAHTTATATTTPTVATSSTAEMA
jgi:hypothetical protein